MEDSFQKLYIEFLNGKISPDRFEEFKKQLNNLPDAELAKSMEEYWLSREDHPALDAVRKQRIREKLYTQTRPAKKQLSVRWYRVAIAAAVAVLFTVAVWNLAKMNTSPMQEPFLAEVTGNSKVELTLPDKSSVKLNSESSLSYMYENGKRVTKLVGEAYFQVVKDKEHPFVVQVGDLNIEVLGTSFNVCSYNDSDVIETSLIEGSVRLYDSANPKETYMLKPSQKAIYSKNDRKISLQDTDNVKEIAWLQNHLIFESEKLGVVFHRIERWYGVKITLMCPEIANDLISGSFKNEQLHYVMEALKMQYGFDYRITGNNILIDKADKLK